MALTLHYHPLSSYCHKVLIALYENETPFTGRVVNLGDETEKAAFVDLWPTGKIPLLQDESAGRVIPETSIMIEYCDRHYPGAHPLLPEEPNSRLEARLWDRLFDSYVMTPMQKIVGDRLRAENERDPRGVAEARATLAVAYGMLERQVATQTWAAGDAFTMADCAAAPALFYASIVAPFPQGSDNLAGYFERLMDRPSVRRTLAEARPFFQYFPFKDAIPERFLKTRL